jgi:hypothetical protein
VLMRHSSDAASCRGKARARTDLTAEREAPLETRRKARAAVHTRRRFGGLADTDTWSQLLLACKVLLALTTKRYRVRAPARVSTSFVLKIASWVASAMVRRVELWDDNIVIPPALAARAAMMAFGDALMDPKLPNRLAVALSGRSRHGGCPPAAARRGRAASVAPAAGRRRQESSRRPELNLERLPQVHYKQRRGEERRARETVLAASSSV